MLATDQHTVKTHGARRWRSASALVCLATLLLGGNFLEPGNLQAAEASSRPNVLLVLADDMGYGDPGCYNPQSKIPTPAIDRLARGGLRFTDAHSPGSVCVPTRYGLLTGRYPHRTSLDWGRKAVIEEGRVTLASLLGQAGYQTGCVGKWHLGFAGGPKYDYTQPLVGGPVDRGFGSFFGLPHSLDIVPYYYIRGNRAVQPPAGRIEASNSPDWSPIQGKFWRAGPIAPGFRHEDVLPRLADESLKWIDQYAGSDRQQPFFLYVALTSPHTPWLPSEEFHGRSQAGLYGDFAAQTDAVLGRLLDSLDKHDLAGNTLLIFTSDKGHVWYDEDEEKYGHRSAGPLRGMKGDAWEGGHRMPFIVRWPGQVPAGGTSDALIGQTDIMATVAAIVGQEVPPGAGEDSVNCWAVWQGKQQDSPRESLIVQSSSRVLTLRQGPWKLIPQLGSCGFTKPRNVKPAEGDPAGQLYNLDDDIAEANNLWDAKPEVVKRLMALLEAQK